jgi:hypothetical protein
MQCPTCKAALPDNARFCNVCGAAIPQGLVCSNCGQPLQPGQRFCMHCGAPVSVAPVESGPATAGAPPPVRGRRWLWWLLPVLLLLVAAAIVAGIAMGLPGLVTWRPPALDLIARRAPTAGAPLTPRTEAPTDLEQLWVQAQQRQAARAWEDELAVLAQIRGADASFRSAEVSSMTVDACAHLALQAEQKPDPSAASAQWDCVLQERPGDAEATAGTQHAALFLRGQDALDAAQYPQAIAAWDELHRAAAGYAGVADRLYLAYVAYGDALCATKSAADIQEGRQQYGLARALAPARPEAIEKLRACQAPTPTPLPTATPLPGPHLGTITDEVATVRVRSGPGAGYFVLGKLSAGNAVTITGRTEDAAWVQVETAPERQGWVSSEYVKANYPREGAPILAMPPLPKRLLVAHASADFAAQQGFREWFYLVSTAPGSSKFIRMPWDSDGTYRWCCDANYSPAMRVWSAGAYPSQRNDAARLWVSPYDGELRISGTAHKEPRFGSGGNGVLVRILQNQDILWENSLGPNDTAATSFDLSVASKSGDEFYFVVSARGNDAGDSTVFDPTIELLHPEGVDMPAPERWAEVAPTPVVVPLTAAPARAPAPALCFEPRLRHYEEHKGCCAEVAGLVYNRQGKPYGPRGAVVRIEGPPAGDRYVREFGVDAGGGYSITALSVNPYTIWLKGPNIRSKKYEVRYDDWATIRILVDFYQVACS